MAPTSAPFFTNTTIVAWAVASLAAQFLIAAVVPGTAPPDPGLPAAVAAAGWGAFIVAGMVCWIGALVVAWRHRAYPWIAAALVPAFLPELAPTLVPTYAILVGMFCGRRQLRGPGGPRTPGGPPS